MYIERFTDERGDLYIKFPLINNLVNNRGWRATPEANERYAYSAIGKPVSLMLDKNESMFYDYHPFDKNAPITDRDAHIRFAEKYAYAHVVDVGKDSGRYKAASGEIPWFATMKVEDPTMIEEWRKPNSKLLPPAFSPGIIQLSGPDEAITKYEILHVASVPSGAFGPKFVNIGKCSGDALACIPELKSATSLENIHAEILSTVEAKQFEGEQEEPLVNPVIWTATIDGRNCGVCERLDGGVFNRDEAERHFPAHDHCRCQLRTELTGGEIQFASYISPKIKRAMSKSKSKTKLKAASNIKTISYKEKTGCCPKDVFSSLLLKDGSSDDNKQMSINSNANSTPGPGTFGRAEVTSPSGETMATQEVMPKQKPTIKYKKLRFTGSNSTEPKPNDNAENEGGEGSGETESDAKADSQFRSSKYYKQMQDMQSELQKRTQIWDYKEKRYQLEKIITPDLFTDQNGKFQQKKWEQEIEQAIKENVPMQWLQQFYANKRQLMQVPELKVKRGSSVEYDGLVTLQGASSIENDEDKIRARKALELNGGF